MTINDIPEDNWPSIPVVGPEDTPNPPDFTTFRISGKDEVLLDDVLAFYHETLIPQLACAPDGSSPAHPQKGWIMSSDLPRTVIVCMADQKIVGAWIVKDYGEGGAAIYYPCAQMDFIALIYRALWAETIQHWDYVWGDTSNPIIMAFAQKAVRRERWYGTPDVNDKRIEWRRA